MFVILARGCKFFCEFSQFFGVYKIFTLYFLNRFTKISLYAIIHNCMAENLNIPAYSALGFKARIVHFTHRELGCAD